MGLFDEDTKCEDTKCRKKEWCALDDYCAHPLSSNSDLNQNLDQVNSTFQGNDEVIIIKDSCDVEVETTSTEVAVTVQLAIQVAVFVIVQIAILDDIEEAEITQDLLQLTKIKQLNKQKTIIENSRGVEVRTQDTSIAVSLQIAVQILVVVLFTLEVL
ncbi:spore coat protein [Terrilactibacillus sp. BCM23-1]|uniref:Spore coat protein n=1 Tax=Terrilactibacillus tamarindi TaxID=2599694 RepID=A0A6N8CSX1_9BACI|nr:spore coat protein [Terrilactibacillus tamarindi]MTT33151.1 spore coat protein [Terrilactibacillus tamarindi]